MTMRRRIFLKSLASTVALTSLAAKKKPSKPLVFDRNLISVLLGPSFDGQSEFSIVHGQSEPLRYLIYEDEQLLQEISYSAVTYPDSDFKIDKFLVHNLPIDRDLKIKILLGQKQIDERTFSCISSKRTNYSVGLASCMRAAQHEKAMWTSLEAQNADVMLFLGDCVYIDYKLDTLPTPQIHWEQYVETRMVLDFYQWKRLVPTIAIWDDHDFGGNDSDMTYPYCKEVLANFKNFFAQSLSENSFLTPGPGISTKFQLGNQMFLMLDGRSFREKAYPKKIYSFFGKEQEEWIFDSIKDFDGLIWMCNGTQWFMEQGYGESFRKQHPINFNSFIEKLNAADKHVIFASGDVHYSEVCVTPKFVKNKSVELTSSCMHSSNFIALPTIAYSSNRVGSTWLRNYMICKISETASSVSVETECYTKGKRRLFTNKTDFNLG